MFDDDLHIIQTPRIKHLWDVTNFIDVMIVLLIFLIGTTTFSKVGISLNQPASTTASAVPPKVLEMDMDADVDIFFERESIDEDKIKEMVRATLTKDPNMVINIRTDKTTETGPLFELMDWCREAGGKKFSFGAVRK